MNNTHKLLLAFIEASGYEVEEKLRYKGTEEGRDYEINDYKVTKKPTKEQVEQRKRNYETALDAQFGAGIISEYEHRAAMTKIALATTTKAAKPGPTDEERLQRESIIDDALIKVAKSDRDRGIDIRSSKSSFNTLIVSGVLNENL